MIVIYTPKVLFALRFYAIFVFIRRQLKINNDNTTTVTLLRRLTGFSRVIRVRRFGTGSSFFFFHYYNQEERTGFRSVRVVVEKAAWYVRR